MNLDANIQTFVYDEINNTNKIKEQSVIQYIVKIFSESEYLWIFNKNLNKTGLNKYTISYPDIRTELDDRIIMIEVDENQHETYDQTKEIIRMQKFGKNHIQKSVFVIRFNPDSYSVDNVKYASCWEKHDGNTRISDKQQWDYRLIKLSEIIKLCIDCEPNKNITTAYLYYDINCQNNTDNCVMNQIIGCNNSDYKNILTVKQLKFDECEMDYSTKTNQTYYNLCKKIFDKCYSQDRFECPDYLINIGIAITNIFNDYKMVVDLFDHCNSKRKNYKGYEETISNYQTTVMKNLSEDITIMQLYQYGMEDNKKRFISIMNKNEFKLDQINICEYIKIISAGRFKSIISGDEYILYCHNGKFWRSDDILLRKYISEEINIFLTNMLNKVYFNVDNVNELKTKINQLKSSRNLKSEIVNTYKEYGVDINVKFDNQWWLFGFNNLVYDLKEGHTREYKFNDYVSLTTKYDWREPTDEEINTINKLIDTIMPVKEEKKLYLQTLCTTLGGRCTERFIFFNGNGNNGRRMINDMLLLALGQYGFLGNNSILFEKNKTGSNPEKACLHQKRCVIFREPCERDKFQNAIVKELTGGSQKLLVFATPRSEGGNFSAGSHYEKDTEKELHMTMIVECNKRPLFAEEPQDAELRRLIDVHFKSKFVTNKSEVDETKHVYLANAMYKTKEFQEKHKFALLKILFDAHKEYKNNNYAFEIPKNIEDHSKQYLELSCNIVEWFKESYKITEDSKDILKLKDLFDSFKASDYYDNLTKLEKRKYNKKYFVDHVSDNIFFKKYYHVRYGDYRNVLNYCAIKTNNDED